MEIEMRIKVKAKVRLKVKKLKLRQVFVKLRPIGFVMFSANFIPVTRVVVL